MSNHLGDFFKARRLELGLSLGDLARRLGYRNVGKGARRLLLLEQEGNFRENFLVRVMEEVGVDPVTVQDLLDRDREEYVAEWERWANEPVPMQLVIRCIPGVFASATIPENITTPEEAVAYGQEKAKRIHKMVFVLLSRRESVRISEQGEIVARITATPDRDAAPFMQIGNRKFLMRFDRIGDPEPYKRPDQSEGQAP